jgi:hypothetical protein
MKQLHIRGTSFVTPELGQSELEHALAKLGVAAGQTGTQSIDQKQLETEFILNGGKFIIARSIDDIQTTLGQNRARERRHADYRPCTRMARTSCKLKYFSLRCAGLSHSRSGWRRYMPSRPFITS